MDARIHALKTLGLGPDAEPEEVEQAYKSRSRPVKRALLAATTAEDKLRQRDELRQLVVLRDLARGQHPPRDWRGSGLGISTGELVEELEHVDLGSMDALYARAFLEVSHGAREEQVRDAFRLRARALTRRFAREEEDEEMERVRRAANTLRRVLHRALEQPPPDAAAAAPVPAAPPEPVRDEEVRVERVAPDPDPVPAAVDPRDEEVVLAERTATPSAPAPADEEWTDRPSDLPEAGETLGEAAAFGEEDTGSPSGPVSQAASREQALRLLGVGFDATPTEVVYAYKTQARGLRVAALLAERDRDREALIRDLRTLRRNRDLALGRG